jgi:prepilin-type N-terminal cleavage/methylation domain-containing protein
MQGFKMAIRGYRPTEMRERGFTLIELVIVMLILSAICAAVFSQIEQIQQRAVAEQGKVDDFQQTRDFVDQVFRDTRQIGYPNVRNFDVSAGIWQSPLINDSRLAAGLIKATSTQLQFEGDVDGSGNVSIVSYMLNGSGNCSNCLQRAQAAKANGDPLTGQTNLTSAAYSTEIENVTNTSSVFSVYDSSGIAITLPIDIHNNASAVASVKTIQVNLTVSSATSVDPKTGQPLEANVTGTMQIVNCSMATTGTGLTCQ